MHIAIVIFLLGQQKYDLSRNIIILLYSIASLWSLAANFHSLRRYILQVSFLVRAGQRCMCFIKQANNNCAVQSTSGPAKRRQYNEGRGAGKDVAAPLATGNSPVNKVWPFARMKTFITPLWRRIMPQKIVLMSLFALSLGIPWRSEFRSRKLRGSYVILTPMHLQWANNRRGNILDDANNAVSSCGRGLRRLIFRNVSRLRAREQRVRVSIRRSVGVSILWLWCRAQSK